jgi:D-lactate dehydrogenase (cytochrome)
MVPPDGYTTTERPSQDVISLTIRELSNILPNRVSTSMAVREQYATDFSFHKISPADAVVTAHTSDEVSSIVKICAKNKVPIIPHGTGTSLEGHLAALRGGICVNLSEMNNIVELNAEDMDVTVEPGVTRKQLNEYLRDTGLFFPIDPGADASIGGMTATRASGTNAVRYGTMKDNVLRLEVVTPDGSIIQSGSRARKSSAGYDLTRLYVGSEGTLGIITKITIKLFGIPEAISSAVVNFESLEGAVNAVISTIQWGIPIARIELLDEWTLEAINKYSKTSFPVKPTLFLEFHGSDASVKEQAEKMGEICNEFEGNEFKWTMNGEERNTMWQARHDAALACVALRPGSKLFTTDVCVPISQLVDCILETKKDIDDANIVAPIVGHVGDGNFHVALLIGPDEFTTDLKVANEINSKLIKRALDMGGTCTGEHGIGQGKMQYMRAEHGLAVEIMGTLKRSLDPDDIMNPGKIVSI